MEHVLQLTHGQFWKVDRLELLPAQILHVEAHQCSDLLLGPVVLQSPFTISMQIDVIAALPRGSPKNPTALLPVDPPVLGGYVIQ